jgi:hypothetical protein
MGTIPASDQSQDAQFSPQPQRGTRQYPPILTEAESAAAAARKRLRLCEYCGSEPSECLVAGIAKCAITCCQCGCQGPIKLTMSDARAAWNRLKA